MNVNAAHVVRANVALKNAVNKGDAMVSTGLNPGESASREDTPLTVQTL